MGASKLKLPKVCEHCGIEYRGSEEFNDLRTRKNHTKRKPDAKIC
jgi:hypothetical protein